MTGGRSRQEMSLIAGSGLAMALIFLLVKDSLTDDAYITLAYAKNLALDLHWGLIPHEVSNSATSPLNVLLVGAATTLTRVGGGIHPVLALGFVSVGLATVMGWAWTRVLRALRLPFAAGVVGVALVLANPFLLSAVGLEVLLIPTLLILLLAMALEGRPGWFALVAGLLLLTRLDLVVFALAILVATPAIRREWRRTSALIVAVAGPWFLFSWVYFGSAVPDTLVTKSLQEGIFGIWTYFSGPVMYYNGLQEEVAFALVPAVIGGLLLAAWLAARAAVRWSLHDPIPAFAPVAALAAGGVAHYLTFAVLDPGPYHWYYVPPTVSLSMFAALAAGRWLTVARERPEMRASVPALVLGCAVLLALANVAVALGQGVPWRSPVVFGNWASAEDYARVGRELRERVGDRTVASPGEIGTLAYFCECAIVDEFSDRGRVIDRVDEYVSRVSPVTRPALKLNYLWLDRDQEPRPADFRLRYERPPGSGPNSWRVWSAARGPGVFTLERMPGG